MAAPRAKVRINHPKMGGTSGLLAKQGRGCVSSVTSLDTLDKITLRGREPKIMGHDSPNHQARIVFDYDASHSFIIASCVKELGLEVETLEKLLHVSSHLGTRVSVDLIC